MDDYYGIGFDFGYRGYHDGPFDRPSNDGDDYSFRRGLEDGQRRRDIAQELDREQFGED